MSTAVAEKPQRFTWADYRSWTDDQRWEIIDGDAYAMSPSPLVRHQRIFSRLYLQMAPYFQGKRCELFQAPMDVKLSDQDIVQPDLFVVCNPKKIRRTHINGAPDLAIEILSPSSMRHDRRRKTQLYAKFGVGEFWLVAPYPFLVEVLTLDRGAYRLAGVYAENDRLVSPAFPDLAVDLATVFDTSIAEDEKIDEIRETTPPYIFAAQK